ncbi:MAG: V-type ATP synthase subunit E family protein [bacterium]|nr:V-type ATP synthase subunit E family protein [bacterium]
MSGDEARMDPEDRSAADLCRRIAEDARRRADEAIARAETLASARLAQAAADAEAEAAAIVARAEAAAVLAAGKARARAEIDARRMELAAREELIAAVLEEVRRRIRALRAAPGWRDLLKALILEAARDLGEADVEILLPAEDRTVADAAFMRELEGEAARAGVAGSFRIGERAAAGTGPVARSADGRVEVNNTLEARLERSLREARTIIARALFGEES